MVLGGDRLRLSEDRVTERDVHPERVAADLPMDVGPLRTARYTEPFSLVIARLAYQGRGGPERAYRFERLGERVP